MNILDSTDYQTFIKNMFYYDARGGASDIEPDSSTNGNIYYRNTGKIMPVKYGNEYLFLDKLSISVNNGSSPNPMMIGTSQIYTSGTTSNYEQDVFSTKYPIRTISLGGAATKVSLAWRNILYNSIFNTIYNSNVYEPTNAPILKSASLSLNNDVKWDLTWEMYDTDAQTPVISEDILLNNVPLDYDRTLKWYDTIVVIPPGDNGLYDKVKFLSNSNLLYFYATSATISYDISYDTIFVLKKNSLPLINIKRITTKINLDGFAPIGTLTTLPMFNNSNSTSSNNLSKLFYDIQNKKSVSTDDELQIYISNQNDFTRIDNLIPWYDLNSNPSPFNLVDKVDVSVSPNEPAKISISITKIYS